METPVKLRTKVREVYDQFGAMPRVEVNEIVLRVTATHPELVEKEKDRLFRETIAAWVRSLCHKEDSSQLALPLALTDVDPPARIAVRSNGQKSGPATWVRIDEATYDELDRKVASLEARRKVDTELVSLIQIRDYLKPHMEKLRRNEAIGPMLAELRSLETAEEAAKNPG
jgi:hypothetical protein